MLTQESDVEYHQRRSRKFQRLGYIFFFVSPRKILFGKFDSVLSVLLRRDEAVLKPSSLQTEPRTVF